VPSTRCTNLTYGEAHAVEETFAPRLQNNENRSNSICRRTSWPHHHNNNTPDCSIDYCALVALRTANHRPANIDRFTLRFASHPGLRDSREHGRQPRAVSTSLVIEWLPECNIRDLRLQIAGPTFGDPSHASLYPSGAVNKVRYLCAVNVEPSSAVDDVKTSVYKFTIPTCRIGSWKRTNFPPLDPPLVTPISAAFPGCRCSRQRLGPSSEWMLDSACPRVWRIKTQSSPIMDEL